MAGTGGAPFLNPFGAQTPEGLAYLNANTVTGTLQDMKSELSSLTAVASRQFGNLPGGPMSIGLAGEFRQEENVFNDRRCQGPARRRVLASLVKPRCVRANATSGRWRSR